MYLVVYSYYCVFDGYNFFMIYVLLWNTLHCLRICKNLNERYDKAKTNANNQKLHVK